MSIDYDSSASWNESKLIQWEKLLDFRCCSEKIKVFSCCRKHFTLNLWCWEQTQNHTKPVFRKTNTAWHIGKLRSILNCTAATSVRMNINEFCHFCHKSWIFPPKCNFHYISNYVLCLIKFWGGSDGEIFGIKLLCLSLSLL